MSAPTYPDRAPADFNGVTDIDGNPVELSRRGETVAIACVLARLPYPTRLAISFALDVQDCLPTDRSEDEASLRLRRALELAGVSR